MSGAEPGGLALRDVVAGYGGRAVLRGVRLRVDPGEVVGLIGPNGSGKTTLIRASSRGLRPMAGEVRVAGADPYAMGARLAARLVAVVPQELAPAFAYSVEEVVSMGRAPHVAPWSGARADDRSAVARAMEAADVAGLADRQFQELSGGERQRVVLAQALAQEAPVLLLDEPTTHLDVRHVLDLLALVRSLARARRVAVLAVFHDLNLAAAACDRLIALSDGRVAAEGAPERVITPALLSDVYGVEAEVARSQATGRPAVVIAPGLHGPPPGEGSVTVHVIGGGGRGAEVMRALVESGMRVTAGVLHATDTDATVAAGLGLPRVTVPPFSEVDVERAAACAGLARAAACVVVCDAPFGSGNVRNLDVAGEAAAAGVPVVLVEATPVESRDFTGGRATGLWRALAASGRVVASDREVPAAVRELAGRGTGPGPDPA